MPIINLTVDGKQTINDTGNVKIVCMNSDYIVQFTFRNCDKFIELPYKRLVVKYDRVCLESNITQDPNTEIYQAVLPIIENQSRIELGVCGRDSDSLDAEDIFTSKPAWFDCEKSVLSGAVVLKTDPVFTPLEVTANGEYRPYEYNADGFSNVSVHIPEVRSESRVVQLSMASGNQIVYPSKSGAVMSQVTIHRPQTLTPENIVKGVDIGGIVGSYEVRHAEKEIYVDGEYTPPDGYGGFSKVVVRVGTSNFSRTMYVGESFTYNYDSSVRIAIDTEVPGIMTYAVDENKVTFSAHKVGECGLQVTDCDASGNVIKTVYYSIVVNIKEDETLPVEAYTVGEMQEYLERGLVGAVIKYMGPTADGFINGELYILQEEK